MRRVLSTIRSHAIPCALALSAAFAAPAHAVLDLWGTFTEGDTQFCAEGVCDGTILQEAEDGGLLVSFSSVAFVPEDPATSPGNDFAAEAAIVGAQAVPQLRALAVAPVSEAVPPTAPGRFISTATAEAVQGYEYVGAASDTLTLTVVPEAVVTGFGLVSGFVGIFEADSFDRLGEFHGVNLASTIFLLDATRNIEAEPLVFPVDPGDEFYVWAALFATADSREATPSSADAFHTLTMEFDDPSGLVAATAVPEAGGGAVVAWGLVVLRAFARRARSERRRRPEVASFPAAGPSRTSETRTYYLRWCRPR
jgi:hypothetical protein